MASTLLTETVGMCSNGDEKHVSDGKVYREGKEVSASYFVDCHSIVTVTMFFFLIIGNLHHSTIFSQYFERLPGSAVPSVSQQWKGANTRAATGEQTILAVPCKDDPRCR
eukprot:762604-Hanusia_phi.AAC.7